MPSNTLITLGSSSHDFAFPQCCLTRRTNTTHILYIAYHNTTKLGYLNHTVITRQYSIEVFLSFSSLKEVWVAVLNISGPLSSWSLANHILPGESFFVMVLPWFSSSIFLHNDPVKLLYSS